MSNRLDLPFEDRDAWANTPSFENNRYADLDEGKWTPCTPFVDALMTIGTFLLALAPVLIVFAFWMAK